MEEQLRLGELVATLALAQDNAFGQPLESQLRSCLLATWICDAAGFEPRIGYESDDMVLIQALVAAELCVATLPGLDEAARPADAAGPRHEYLEEVAFRGRAAARPSGRARW